VTQTAPPIERLRTDATLREGARVLLVRLSALGDVLFALETLASLKAERPDVRVDFLVDERFSDLLRGHPQIENVLTSPRKRASALPAALWRLRSAGRYDAVLDLHGILKSALHVVFTRTGRRLGYLPPGARESAHLAYGKNAVVLPTPLPHRAERGRYLLRALGLRAEPAPVVLAPPDRPPTLYDDGARDRPRLVVHPGTSAFAAFKRWPAAHYGAMLERLVAARPRTLVHVAFGPGEKQLAEDVLAAWRALREDGSEPPARLLDGGALGLRGFAAALGQTDVVVAGDTGPLHIAAAAGARVVALFGPKNPDLYGPRSPAERTRLLYHDVPCRPCTRRTCPSPQCVLGIPVDAALAATIELLDLAAEDEVRERAR
jgi:heptosyltransferase-1